MRVQLHHMICLLTLKKLIYTNRIDTKYGSFCIKTKMLKRILLMTFIAVTTANNPLTEGLLSEEEVAKVKAIHDNCLKSTSVDVSLVQKILKSGEFTDDEKVKEHILCCHKGLGFQNEAGEIMQDVMVNKFTAKFQNEAMVRSAVDKCSQTKGTPQETAFELAKCLHSFAPEDLDIGSFLL